MEDQYNEVNRPVNPRRKKRTKAQIFKESYLPVIIIAVAVVLIIVFIIGSITRAVQKKNAEEASSIAAASSLAEEKAKQEQAISDLLAEAEALAAGYDYEGAIAVLNGFDGDLSKEPRLNDQIIAYETALRNCEVWDDPSKVINLSFQMLLADPARGFSHDEYASLINRNFITTAEFSKILLQLYENGYILVDMDDFITTEIGPDGTKIYKSKPMHLPTGKKPIMLTETNVNYNYYLVDSNEDKVPDKDGGGFASKLVWDGNKFYCEMVDASGNTVTGAYDVVPILEDFIATHPGFSYKGARATLALTGYNGLFGYRTHPGALDIFGQDDYQKAFIDAKKLTDALREKGYTIACYTYENIPYGDNGLFNIQNDLASWKDEVVTILGNVDMLVYAQLSDIADPDESYSGEVFEAVYDEGFRYYLGFCEDDGKPWATVTEQYVRQGRLLVTGSNLAHNEEWFTNLFDASMVLDTTRGDVPE